MQNSNLSPLPGNPKELEPIERALLALSYGVHVIGSVDSAGSMNAMLADWVMQVSFRPRLVAVAIENDARTLRYIKQTKVFSVNLLHEKDGMEIARKVVMPAEGRKIKGRSEEAAAVINYKLAEIDHGVHPNGCPCSTKRSAGSHVMLNSSWPPATTRSSSERSPMVRSSASAKC